MPVSSRQARIRDNKPITNAELDAVQDLSRGATPLRRNPVRNPVGITDEEWRELSALAARARNARRMAREHTNDSPPGNEEDAPRRLRQARRPSPAPTPSPPRAPTPPSPRAPTPPPPPRAPTPPRVAQELDELRRRIEELEEYRWNAIGFGRPFYAVRGSKRTADLEARLADNVNPPDAMERANILGMLEVNKRYKWWKRRHPQ